MMNLEQALQVVEQYRADWALPGLLETLMQMKQSEPDLLQNQAHAFRVVHEQMSQLFA
jgi:hypothetical protein